MVDPRVVVIDEDDVALYPEEEFIITVLEVNQGENGITGDNVRMFQK